MERVLESMRILIYDVDLAQIYTQSTNLPLAAGENIVSFFARADSVTRLASFYLDDPSQIESFLSSNLRLQFLNTVGTKFTDFIRARELTQRIVYSPMELLRIYLEWSKGESSPHNTGSVSINRVSSDLQEFMYGNPNSNVTRSPSSGWGRGKGRQSRA